MIQRYGVLFFLAAVAFIAGFSSVFPFAKVAGVATLISICIGLSPLFFEKVDDRPGPALQAPYAAALCVAPAVVVSIGALMIAYSM